MCRVLIANVIALTVLTTALCNTHCLSQVSLSRGWQHPQTLVLGQPQVGSVSDGEFAYFKVLNFCF
jgi:hypothetical protein